MEEIRDGDVTWRFADVDFLRSNWTCIWGRGCLGIHDELVDVHVQKSKGYGNGTDPLANYTAVGAINGRPPYMYAVDRIIEKLTRVQSLEAQGRTDELEEEFKDVASLALCAEALRRRG